MIVKIKTGILLLLTSHPVYPSAVVALQSAVQIRKVQDQDFNAIKALGLKTFIQVYKLTDTERIEAVRKVYSATIDSDNHEIHDDKTTVAVVAVYQNTIIGYLSAVMTTTPLQAYVRTLIVDPSFQKQGISRLLVKQCRALLPPITNAVCLTNKKNILAQKFYEHLGGRRVENAAWSNYLCGKRVENAPWSSYLYSNLNPSDFVGYTFGQTSLEKFSTPDRVKSTVSQDSVDTIISDSASTKSWSYHLEEVRCCKNCRDQVQSISDSSINHEANQEKRTRYDC